MSFLAHLVPSFPCHRWLLAAALAALLAACGGGGSGNPAAGGGDPPPGAPLAIESSNPAQGATGVDRAAQPELTLTAAVPAEAASLACAGIDVPATVSAEGRLLRLTPQRRLLPLAPCKLQVANGPALDFTTVDGAWGAVAPLEHGNLQAQSPRLAADGQGNVFAVWRAGDGGTAWVMASRYQPGTGWSTPHVLDAGDVPQVTVDAAGNAVALWVKSDETGVGIWTSRYTADAGWSSPQALDSQPDNVGVARIAGNAAGDAVAVWLQEDGVSARYNVWANRYVPGQGWQGPQRVEQLDQQAYDAVVAVAPSGEAMVVWVQSDGTRFNALASASARAGAWSAPVEVDTSPQSVGNPVLVAAADGSFAAAWTQVGGNFIQFWANFFVPDSGWTGAARVDQAPNGISYGQLAVGPAGSAVAAWVQNEAADQNVWSNSYARGSGWGTAQRVETGPFDARSPLVAVDAAGNALVVWRQQEDTGGTTWASRRPAGGAWGTATHLGTPYTVDTNVPALAMDASGSAMVAWDEYDGETRYKVMFNRFD